MNYSRTTVSRTVVQPHRRTVVQPYSRRDLQPHSRTAVQPYSRTAAHPYRRTAVQTSSRTAVQPYKRTAAQSYRHTVVQPYRRTVVQPHTSLNFLMCISPQFPVASCCTPPPKPYSRSTWTKIPPFCYGLPYRRSSHLSGVVPCQTAPYSTYNIYTCMWSYGISKRNKIFITTLGLYISVKIVTTIGYSLNQATVSGSRTGRDSLHRIMVTVGVTLQVCWHKETTSLLVL